MPLLRLETFVRALVQRVFDLARDIDFHMLSTSRTRERAVAGRTTGLIGLGETVTWRARHFGVWQNLTVQITQFEEPSHFRDTMVRGAFKRFDHDHFFQEAEGGTLMIDVFDYQSPLGPLGRIANWLFLERYMRRFLVERNAAIKKAAEEMPGPPLYGAAAQA